MFFFVFFLCFRPLWTAPKTAKKHEKNILWKTACLQTRPTGVFTLGPCAVDTCPFSLRPSPSNFTKWLGAGNEPGLAQPLHPPLLAPLLAPGASWLLLAPPPGPSWLLLVPPGFSWFLLAPPGSSWLLLALPGSWLLLALPGSSWLLAPPGSPWLLLATPGSSKQPLIAFEPAGPCKAPPEGALKPRRAVLVMSGYLLKNEVQIHFCRSKKRMLFSQ